MSVDGVRQDFVIPQRPAGVGDLQVELALTGARAEVEAYGARLVLDGSGRALAYSRLRATDASGRELKARMEVLSANRLGLRVTDANATYPVRIDPTFSDANWVSLNPGIPGANGPVYAAAVDSNGILYAGGQFSLIGTVAASSIARWNGTTWSALGSGVDGTVQALAVSGTNLYVGGNFTTAGGVPANAIAVWNGSSWSALGTGVEYGSVSALAVNGNNLYAGGNFMIAGEVPVNSIAAWDGSAWSALGSGVDGQVLALAVKGTNVYAAGTFTTAGGMTANAIAAWDGSAWSALGAGINGQVNALAVSGTLLYAGGSFSSAGGVSANCIAAWNGSGWSALGSGILGGFVRDPFIIQGVFSLLVGGNTLYAGGLFATAGGVPVANIAQWNGIAWSALGTGTDGVILALAATRSTLYAGGGLVTARGGARQ